jgi:hypothetical protein
VSWTAQAYADIVLSISSWIWFRFVISFQSTWRFDTLSKYLRISNPYIMISSCAHILVTRHYISRPSSELAPYSLFLLHPGLYVQSHITCDRGIKLWFYYDFYTQVIVPVSVANPSKAWTVFARSDAGIVGSNPTQGMDVWCVCMRLFCLCFPVTR